MVNYKEFYINNKPKPGKTRCCEEELNNSIDCNGILPQQLGEYLKTKNHLSEYSTNFDREQVLDNLGISLKLLLLNIGFTGEINRLTEDIILRLDKRIGWIYEDDENQEYKMFSNRSDFELYLSNPLQNYNLIILSLPFFAIYTGDEPPDNKHTLWIDTTNDYLSPTSLYIYNIQKAIRALLELVDVLMGIRVRGAISGLISDGTRTSIARSTVPIMPDKIITSLYELYLDGFIDEEEYYQTFEEDVNSGYINQEVLDKYYHKGYISEEKYTEYSDILDSLDENGIQPNYEEGKEPTVSHISIKMGTWELLLGNLLNFINGELIWCTGNIADTLHNNKLYIHNNGVLYAIGSGGTSGEEETMDDQRVEELIGEKLSSVESIGFIPVGSDEAKYTAKVNKEGVLIVYENELDNQEPAPTSNYYYAGSVSETGLLINSFYLGGDYDEHSYLGCSHNFVEISNVWVDKKTAKPKDINLNGFYLLYLGKGEAKWQVLPLWGKIPGGGTFLIRGAQCSVMDANTTKIKVKTYDMLWYVTKLDSNENEYLELIKFSQEGAVFYLCWSPEPGKFYELGSDTLVNLDLFSTTSNLINVDAGTCARGYIDMASFNSNDIYEKNTYTLANGKYAKDVIFRRWYMLDPVTLSNAKEGITSHNNVKYLTSSFLNESNVNNNIVEFTPKASFEHKSIKNTRSLFKEDKPSTLTCTFGILATDNSENKTVLGKTGATRGFCWNSVGYFDEYLMFRKKGSSTWIKVESIKEELDPLEYINNLPEGVNVPSCISNYYNYFTRLRWESAYGLSITTHKVLITGLVDDNENLSNGTTYEYKVVRDNGVAYKEGYQITEDSYIYESDIREFTVKADSKVSDFNFVQVTDQQGANWEEYEVWNLSARIIAREENSGGIQPYDFIINTGDICYNGSRSNEWIDYYDGYAPLNNKEEMLTVGNNDLAPISMRDIGNGKESPWKINVGVGDYFYCVEIDSNNPQVFTGVSAKDGTNVQYKIPSLYSFNYGLFHFVSLLSEIRTISNKVEDGETRYLSQSTVNSIFGIVDELRNESNLNASKIYDVEEEWIIKDLLLWKGQSIPAEFNRDEQRYNINLVDNCEKCIFFIHEMPFNIISESVYTAYNSGNTVPRETAKAYLNRYHNYEYLRLFKLWGVRLAMGGHKHTVALTGPVYDAPPGYNPITKLITGENITHHETDDILNDTFDSEHTTGMFDPVSSVRPFLQVTPTLFNSQDEGENFRWEVLQNVCAEVYNNTLNTTITINKQSLVPHESTTTSTTKPKIRLEIVDSITAPLYVMCLATGFKNKSNSELAAASGIPWEDFYVKSNELKDLCYPFFTHYSVSSNQIDTKMYKIVGMYNSGDNYAKGSTAGYWDLNKIYVHGDTLEENRNYFERTCTIELYNNNGTTEYPRGSIISLN